MPAGSLYAIILVTLIGMIAFWGAHNLNAELRRSYPSEWENLGRPTSFSRNSMGQELRWIGFIVFRKYRKFRDPRLSMFGNVVFFCGLVNFAILILFAFIPHRVWPIDL